MNQKQKAALNGEKTKMNFLYLNLIRGSKAHKTAEVQKIVTKIYRQS